MGTLKDNPQDVPQTETGLMPEMKPATPVIAVSPATLGQKPQAAKPKEKTPSPHATKLNIFDSLSLQEEINFARHLAIVIKAGIPLYQGIGIIRPQTTSRTLMKILDQMLIDLGNGRFLADSLERYQDVFGGFFVNIVRVGESSGTLAQNLLYLADELKKSRSLKSKVRSAMVYPMMILLATLGVVGFLTFFVFPKLLPVLHGLNVTLPASTVALISIVNFLQNYGIVTTVGVIAFLIIMNILLKKVKAIRYVVHRMIFLVPVVSELSVNLNMVNFTRVLSLLMKSGMRILEAVKITAGTFDNLVYQRALLEASEGLRKGGQIADYLIVHKKFFPQLLSGMIKIGEGTGSLEANLEYLSSYYEEEVDYKLHNLTSLLEPIMLLFMGLLVGFVAISIITPIYSISQGIK